MTTTESNANDLLMGAGGRSAKFEKEGDTVLGFVEHTETRQRTDFKTGALMEWPDGNPRMQLVVTLKTDLREGDDDDGLRNVYIPIPSQLQKAVADAIRKKGERGIGVGGQLWVKFVSTDPPVQKGMNGAKQYTAAYEPPTQALTADDGPPPLDDADAPF